jgi:carotenoid cleavage dioxygenase-like enzyme
MKYLILCVGEIPSWLEGKLLRNGPGIQKIGEYQYNHLFDGLSILHNFIIKDGKVIKLKHL